LQVDIASYEDMKARTMAIVRGKRRVGRREPKVWFTSMESFARVLSAGHRKLLDLIAKKSPESLGEMTGRAKSNLSRTLKTMEGYGLVRLTRGHRGRIAPKVVHDRIELNLALTRPRRSGSRVS
jgi:predicted transcriptional regulator